MLDHAIETLDDQRRAPHPVAHFAFADGSVRPIGVKLSQATLGRTANREDGDPINAGTSW